MSLSWIKQDIPALILAPMEGITDAPMRALMTERGGFSFCVSEFLRISQHVPPKKTYFEHIPELRNGCKTPSGTPIQVQILGGHEGLMAESAYRAFELGARGIDINFGCPAPIVNRHDGGAFLLRHPSRIRNIVKAVREALPKDVPVSAKLRLGWENPEDILTNADQAILGGASWLTIHARTKSQGYAPPVHWKYIGEIKKRSPVPIVANGDIWSREDFLSCREITGCRHFMIGRGALAEPSLAQEIARTLGIPMSQKAIPYPYPSTPQDWEPMLRRFWFLCEPTTKGTQYSAARIKQWLKLAETRQNISWFNMVKQSKSVDEIFVSLGAK